MAVTYQLILGPAARRFIGHLAGLDQQQLTGALRTELADGPNESVRFEFVAPFDYDRADAYPGGGRQEVYAAIPLSFCAYTAVYRELTGDEVQRLDGELAQATGGIPVFYVFCILPAEAAFSRPRPRQ